MALVKAYGFRQQLGTTAVRVRRGLAWLKKDGPLYGLDYRRIDPNMLQVANPGFCPLAQASSSGRYSAVIARLSTGELFGRDRFNSDWITDHGFDVGPWDGADGYAQLDQAWRIALEDDRREQLR